MCVCFFFYSNILSIGLRLFISTISGLYIHFMRGTNQSGLHMETELNWTSWKIEQVGNPSKTQRSIFFLAVFILQLKCCWLLLLRLLLFSPLWQFGIDNEIVYFSVIRWCAHHTISQLLHTCSFSFRKSLQLAAGCCRCLFSLLWVCIDLCNKCTRWFQMNMCKIVLWSCRFTDSSPEKPMHRMQLSIETTQICLNV